MSGPDLALSLRVSIIIVDIAFQKFPCRHPHQVVYMWGVKDRVCHGKKTISLELKKILLYFNSETNV